MTPIINYSIKLIINYYAPIHRSHSMLFFQFNNLINHFLGFDFAFIRILIVMINFRSRAKDIC